MHIEYKADRNNDLWQQTYSLLKEIRQTNESLNSDSLEDILQKLELIEKELNLLASLMEYL